MSLTLRLWLAGLSILATVLALGVAVQLDYAEIQAALAESSQAARLARQAENLLSDLKDAETGQRGYLLTGVERYLSPYEDAASRVTTRLSGIRELADPEASTIARLDKLKTLIDAKLSELAETISLRRERGFAAALAVVQTDRGQTVMDQIRGVTAEVIEEEDRKLTRLRRDLAYASSRLHWLLLTGVPFALLVVIGSFVTTAGSVRRRFRLLEQGIVRVATDGATTLAVAGGGEFRRVALAFNEMQQRLSQEETERRGAECALAESNATLAERSRELEARNRSVDRIRTLANRLPSCSDLEEFAGALQCFVPQILPDSAGALYVLNNSGNLFRAVTEWSDPVSAPAHFGPMDCWGLRRGQLHVVHGFGSDLTCCHVEHAKVSSYCCIPLIAHGSTVGLLYFEGEAEATAGDMQMLVETVALALANLRLRQDLRNQSIRDLLSGLLNRRYLEEALDLELARARRARSPISVIMIDVDHFKRFNDTFGHDAGDLVIREIGGLLSRQVRKGDLACRYGGEEFTIVLPGTDAENGLRRARRICEAARELQVDRGGQRLGPVTISLGVATFPEHGEDVKTLLATADAALYRAKQSGRDRVVTADARGEPASLEEAA